MEITFYGAAKTTTGSMHLIKVNGHSILLDCGLYQGKRKEAFERNRAFPFNPMTVEKVILSHAHVDHSGNLPNLVKQGFKGEIIATPATCDLCELMLQDTAHLQERDVIFVNKRRIKAGQAPFEPLYTVAEAQSAVKNFSPLNYRTTQEIFPGVKLTFYDAGHIIGSAIVVLDIKTGNVSKRFLFTGDLGQNYMPIINDPEVVQNVDAIVTESTYGDRVHPPLEDVEGRLKGFIDDICQQKSRMIVPAFSVGRTQQLLYSLNELYKKRRIPEIPIYVDSPLSSKVTAVYAKHMECYDKETAAMLAEGSNPLKFKSVKFITEAEESKKLNDAKGPMIIISASGMCEGGRILHHLAHAVGDPRNIILIVGYQAENTLGRRIVERINPIKIFGEEHELRARVHTINALSAHADRNDLLDYFKKMGTEVERAFVVHGEPAQSESLANAMSGIGIRNVIVPSPGDKFSILN